MNDAFIELPHAFAPCTSGAGGFHFYPAGSQMGGFADPTRCIYCKRTRPSGLDPERIGLVPAVELVERESSEVDSQSSFVARIPSERETLAREFLNSMMRGGWYEPRYAAEFAFKIADEFIAQRDGKNENR